MASLTHLEKKYFEELFNMHNGYVMGGETFSDRKFSEFFHDTIRINIDDPKYGSQSKAKRLKAFLNLESDILVGKVLEELLKIWVYIQPDKNKALTNSTYLEACNTVNRILKKQSKEEIAEDDFLSKDFSSMDLKKLNLEHGLLPVLEHRLKEIKLCLHANASLAVIILSGSMMEGILLNIAITNASKFTQ